MHQPTTNNNRRIIMIVISGEVYTVSEYADLVKNGPQRR